jgi:RNA polymerase sigma factor (sigma-70 family)
MGARGRSLVTHEEADSKICSGPAPLKQYIGKMEKNQLKKHPIKDVVNEAQTGSSRAVEEIVLRFQSRIYGLALRMLSHPEDAKDATQEILIKVIANLKRFRFEGGFQAWVYRIAANHLKTTRKSRMERFEISWEKAVWLVDQAAAKGWLANPPAAPSKMLEIEARLRCTQALLTAMDRPHRLAFISGVVMDISSREGAWILEISPAAFRKRISRARGHLMRFLTNHCGLFDRSNRCSCPGVLANHLQNRWIIQDQPMFMNSADQAESNETLKDCLRELDELSKVSVLFKSFPSAPCPHDRLEMIKEILREDTYRVLADNWVGQES